MAYQRLGTIQVVGQPDSAAGYGFNPFLPGTGWDVLVSASTAAQSLVCVAGQWPYLTEFECYQIHLDGPIGTTFRMLINRQPYNHVAQGFQNYLDPQQPVLLNSGDEVQFAWNALATSPPYTITGGTNVQPTVTMWFRTVSG